MIDTLETARIYYTGSDITVNLIWSLLIFGGLLLLLKPLLGIPLLDNILGAMTGSSPSYGSGISDGYGAPAAGGSEYGAPSPGGSGYSAPQSGYSRGRRAVTLTDEQKSVYSKVANSLPISSTGNLLTQRFALPVQAPLAHPV